MAGKFLLDTNFVIDLLENGPGAIDFNFSNVGEIKSASY